ncbi:MAG: FMN-binding protein, partial [Chloroflexi bacterium]|nr:FMN-binding protein [Chloroflexota bacterium]
TPTSTKRPRPTAAPTTDGSAATPTPTSTLAATPEPTATPAPTSSTQVVDGRPVSTHYGTVQVELTITDGTITDVQALQLPNDRQYSAEISDYVAPYLRKMVLQAQNANIDIISGATYTSTGYAKSVQSALNNAQ